MHAFSMMSWNAAGLQNPEDFYKSVSQHQFVMIQEYGESKAEIVLEEHFGAFVVFIAPFNSDH